MLIGENNEEINITIPDVTSGSEGVEFNISNSEVPQGEISVQIRVKYLGDYFFSNVSDLSNKAGNHQCAPL